MGKHDAPKHMKQKKDPAKAKEKKNASSRKGSDDQEEKPKIPEPKH